MFDTFASLCPGSTGLGAYPDNPEQFFVVFPTIEVIPRTLTTKTARTPLLLRRWPRFDARAQLHHDGHDLRGTTNATAAARAAAPLRPLRERGTTNGAGEAVHHVGLGALAASLSRGGAALRPGAATDRGGRTRQGGRGAEGEGRGAEGRRKGELGNLFGLVRGAERSFWLVRRSSNTAS